MCIMVPPRLASKLISIQDHLPEIFSVLPETVITLCVYIYKYMFLMLMFLHQ